MEPFLKLISNPENASLELGLATPSIYEMARYELDQISIHT
jgi:hypothetical protein